VSELEDCYGSDVVGYCCEKLVAEAGAARESRGKGKSTVGRRYQATANEDSYRLRTLVCV
jgi:hypothetical protein